MQIQSVGIYNLNTHRNLSFKARSSRQNNSNSTKEVELEMLPNAGYKPISSSKLLSKIKTEKHNLPEKIDEINEKSEKIVQEVFDEFIKAHEYYQSAREMAHDTSLADTSENIDLAEFLKNSAGGDYINTCEVHDLKNNVIKQITYVYDDPIEIKVINPDGSTDVYTYKDFTLSKGKNVLSSQKELIIELGKNKQKTDRYFRLYNGILTDAYKDIKRTASTVRIKEIYAFENGNEPLFYGENLVGKREGNNEFENKSGQCTLDAAYIMKGGFTKLVKPKCELCKIRDVNDGKEMYWFNEDNTIRYAYIKNPNGSISTFGNSGF